MWMEGGRDDRGREGQGGGGVDGLLSEDGCGIWQMMPQQHQREREALTKGQSWRVETGTYKYNKIPYYSDIPYNFKALGHHIDPP